MASTPAQKKAIMKYDAKTYSRITVRMRKEERKQFDEYIAAHGYTANGFILEAVREKIERGKNKE